jgi:hypothetical protein
MADAYIFKGTTDERDTVNNLTMTNLGSHGKHMINENDQSHYMIKPATINHIEIARK